MPVEDHLEHARTHQRSQQCGKDCARRYRKKVGVESVWSLEIVMLCPDQCPDDEASIWWDEEVWFARLSLRCDLPPDLLEWCVVHELGELQRWRQANCFVKLANALPTEAEVTYHLTQFRLARNQEIEWQVAAILNHTRPGHLLSSLRKEG